MEKYKRKDMVQCSEFFEQKRVFNISRNTRLLDLKEEVCNFWDISPSEFEFFENDSILTMRYSETVEMYFFTSIDKQRQNVEFFLKSPNRNNFDCIKEGNKEETKRNMEKLNEEIDLPERIKNKRIRAIKAAEIEKIYPGLLSYKCNGKLNRPQDLKVVDHVLSFIILLILVTFSGVILNNKRSIIFSYYMDQGIVNTLSATSNTSIGFADVDTIDEFYNFFQTTFAPYLMDPSSSFLSTNEICGPIRFRQLRVKTKPCLNSVPKGITCYERIYNSQAKGIYYLSAC